MANDVIEQDGGFREALSQSWDKLATEPSAEPAAAPAVETAPPAKVEAETPSEGIVRDEKGRFAGKGEGKPAAASNGTPPARASDAGAQEAAAGVPGGPPAAVAPAAAPASVPAIKAPQSWKPALREKWGTLPAEIQGEVDRREKEIAKALQESAEAQKGAGTWTETVRPYEAQIRAAGANPQQYVGNLLQTAHALAYAPDHQKAAILADIVLQYGGHLLRAVGTDANGQPIIPLDQALVARMNGQQLPQAQQRPQEFKDHRVDQLIQGLQAQENAKLESQIGKFIETHEYANDVHEDMAAVIETWKSQGKDYNSEQALERAYAVACNMNEDVRKIIAQKEAAASAANAQASTQRARVASSSVKSQPGGPSAPPPPGDDTRSHLAAAWDRLASQQ